MNDDILQSTAPILREKTRDVAISDIASPRIQSIIASMQKAMSSQKDGVAIAAPQIGIPLSIFIVSDAILSEADQSYKRTGEDLVFINPVLTKLSRDKHDVEEGCLSIRWKYGKVKRSVKASIEAYDDKGKKIKRGASGLLAQIFQHECDHLNGILFTDTAFDIKDIPPEDLQKDATKRY